MRKKVFIIGFFLLQLLVLEVIYRQIYKRVFKKTKKLTEDDQKDRIKTKKKVTFFACLTIGILAFWTMLLSSGTDEINTETIVIIETVPPTTEKITTQEETPAEIIVHITNTGSKDHRAGCQYLKKSDIPISLENAKKAVMRHVVDAILLDKNSSILICYKKNAITSVLFLKKKSKRGMIFEFQKYIIQLWNSKMRG